MAADFRAAQVRLTNVAVVRYKKNGLRFEVAAYKNKVQNFRQHIEKDLSEVLQTASIFTNVSKALLAKGEDLRAAFGTDDQMACALIILEKGELEVSEKERAQQYEALFKDIASTVAAGCVNPDSQRPYPVSIIEKALRDAHFSVNPSKGTKAQALKAVALLRDHIPLERAKMKLRLTVPAAARVTLRARLCDAAGASIDDEGAGTGPGGGATYVVDVTCDPGLYRSLEEEVARVEGGGGVLEVLSLRAAAGDDGGAASGRGRDDDDADDSAAAGSAGGGSASPAQPRAVHASGAGASSDAVAAAARGTGMVVRRVTQPGARLHCNTCDVHFDGPEAHRAHFRADLHRFNLKRKMRAQPPLPEAEFDALSAAARAAVLDALE